jgi:uncharacterized protein YjbI with pentapeptide repeats
MAIAAYYLGLTIEGDESSPRLTIDGRRAEGVTKDEDGLFSVSGHPETKAKNLYQLGQQIIDCSQELNKKRVAIKNGHLKILKRGVSHWNEWRRKNPATRPLLFKADLRKETLGLPDLNSVDFANANLIGADLRNMHLIEANFHEANLGGAKLQDTDLTRANFCRTDLYKTNLTHANLTEANLQGTQLAGTIFERATLVGCKVYGMSAWDLSLEGSVQQDLIVRYSQKSASENDPDIEAYLSIDNLQVAQFLYMLLNNKNLQPVINATTSRIVLILGRFTPRKRKLVLEAIRNALRKHYVPILFDSTPSDRRDLTETIQLVANLSRFVVADLTDAKGVPQELSHIVPNLPSVPIQPILLASQKEYAMFEHWRRYPWVLPEFLYENQTHLIDHLEEKVILPATTRLQWMSPQVSLTEKIREIEDLKKQLAKLQNASRQEGSAARTS